MCNNFMVVKMLKILYLQTYPLLTNQVSNLLSSTQNMHLPKLIISKKRKIQAGGYSK